MGVFMRACSLALALLVLVPFGAMAQPASPPQFRKVHAVDRETNEVQFAVTEYVMEVREVEVEVEVNGMKVLEKRRFTVVVPRIVLTGMKLEGIDVMTGEGKKLSRDEAFQRLAAGQIVVFATNALAPEYMKVLAKDAIILVVRTP
jgi:hypothetical protein